MSGLHRDINVPHNFPSSRRLQKPRERTGGRAGPGAGRPPSPLGAHPATETNQVPSRGLCSTDLKIKENRSINVGLIRRPRFT